MRKLCVHLIPGRYRLIFTCFVKEPFRQEFYSTKSNVVDPNVTPNTFLPFIHPIWESPCRTVNLSKYGTLP